MNLIRQKILIFGAAVLLIMSGITIIANADEGEGDIWHWTVTGTTPAWEAYTGEKGYIDITSIDHSIDGSEATVTMTLAEDIQDADTTFYYIHLLAGTDYYIAYYANQIGMVIGSGGALAGYYAMLESPVSGNTFTATFTVDDPSATFEARGYALEWTTIGDETAEWWGDWAPDTYFNDYTGYVAEDETEGETEDETEDTGAAEETGTTPKTPGFEIITLIAAIAVAIIILRKRK